MVLTDKHMEALIEAARDIEYGSITIHISATSDKLDLTIQKRVRLENEPDAENTLNSAQKGQSQTALEKSVAVSTGRNLGHIRKRPRA